MLQAERTTSAKALGQEYETERNRHIYRDRPAETGSHRDEETQRETERHRDPINGDPEKKRNHRQGDKWKLG